MAPSGIPGSLSLMAASPEVSALSVNVVTGTILGSRSAVTLQPGGSVVEGLLGNTMLSTLVFTFAADVSNPS